MTSAAFVLAGNRGTRGRRVRTAASLLASKSTNAEVDFVIGHRRSVVPVEVKAGKAGSLRSLHQFLSRDIKGGIPVALRFDLNGPSIAEHQHGLKNGRSARYSILSLPLFMVEHAERLLDAVAGG